MQRRSWPRDRRRRGSPARGSGRCFRAAARETAPAECRGPSLAGARLTSPAKTASSCDRPATKSAATQKLLIRVRRRDMDVGHEVAPSSPESLRDSPLAGSAHHHRLVLASRGAETRIAFACPVKAERTRPWWSSVIHFPSTALPRRGSAATAPTACIPLQCSRCFSAQTGTSWRQTTSGRSAVTSCTTSRRKPRRRGGALP